VHKLLYKHLPNLKCVTLVIADNLEISWSKFELKSNTLTVTPFLITSWKYFQEVIRNTLAYC